MQGQWPVFNSVVCHGGVGLHGLVFYCNMIENDISNGVTGPSVVQFTCLLRGPNDYRQSPTIPVTVGSNKSTRRQKHGTGHTNKATEQTDLILGQPGALPFIGPIGSKYPHKPAKYHSLSTNSSAQVYWS